MCFLPAGHTGHLYQAKDQLPEESTTYVVFSVKCKTCDLEYVGETQRTLKIQKRNTRAPLILEKLKS